MLKLNKDYKGNDLEQQFNLNVDDCVPELWSETQDKVNTVVRKQVDEIIASGDFDADFDATEAMNIFFEAFNTQDLQDAMLLQFVMGDIQERTRRISDNSPDMAELKDMLLQRLKGFQDAQDEQEDIL
jgi:methyl-accepting chemotaxis protein